MRFAWVVAMLVPLGACNPSPRELALDAGADARPLDAPPLDPWLMPFTVSGYTPDGSLDSYRYIKVFYAGTWCSHSYELHLKQTPSIDYMPYLVIAIPMAEDASGPGVGPISASAQVWRWQATGWEDAGYTQQVTFNAERLDPPSVNPATVRGRVVVNAPGWMLDFSVDLVSSDHASCF